MKQPLNEQFTRMQKLAGIIPNIIKENMDNWGNETDDRGGNERDYKPKPSLADFNYNKEEYKKYMEEHFPEEPLNEDKFNALDSSAPDWEDSEGYELLLDSYFNSYNLEDPKEFAYEIYENGDAINDLAFEIAQRGGFKGSLTDLLNDNTMKDFNIYCNNLAKLFFLEHGVAMGVIDRNDTEYQKQVQETNKVITTYEPKIQSVLVKLQGNTNEQISENDIFNNQYSVSNETYGKMDNLVNENDYDNFIKSATNIMTTLTDGGFEAKEIFYYLYTRLTAEV